MSNLSLEKSKAITIDELREDTKGNSIYVLNTSSLKGRRKPAVINIPITTRSGISKIIVIPNTFVPIDLTHQAAKLDILDNPHFLGQIHQRNITLVSREWAIAELAKEDSQEELDRLQAMQDRIDRIMSQPGDDAEIEEPPDMRDDINPSVMDAVERPDHTDTERYLLIKNIADNLVLKDWKYIAENSSNDKIQQYAMTQIKSLNKRS